MKKAGLACTLLVAAALIGPARAADERPLPWAPTPPVATAYARAADIAALGGKLFFDPSLSASGRMACGTCHDPAHAFAAPDAAPVQLGGPDLRHPGTRAVPSLMYGAFTPAFSAHYFVSAEEGDESVDQGPTGGRDWDGRAGRARDQAALPMLDSDEMANASPDTIVTALRNGRYADDIRRLYGQAVFSDPAKAFQAAAEALEYYQETPVTFSPFSSKYDAFLAGRAKLTEQEGRGLATFDNPSKGNCASCHRSAVEADGQRPLFTDFGFVALGLPRNRAIPANDDPAYFDLGLCGPKRHDLAPAAQDTPDQPKDQPKDQPRADHAVPPQQAAATYCGMFKAPTLRNVALKQSFYHNGVIHSLRDAVAFYAERDTNPGKWYPDGPDGKPRKFDDLPPQYRENVSSEPPFGQQSVLSDADIDDIVAFLRTLTDGYRTSNR